jgi:hypothetical protein
LEGPYAADKEEETEDVGQKEGGEDEGEAEEAETFVKGMLLEMALGNEEASGGDEGGKAEDKEEGLNIDEDSEAAGKEDEGDYSKEKSGEIDDTAVNLLDSEKPVEVIKDEARDRKKNEEKRKRKKERNKKRQRKRQKKEKDEKAGEQKQAAEKAVAEIKDAAGKEEEGEKEQEQEEQEQEEEEEQEEKTEEKEEEEDEKEEEEEKEEHAEEHAEEQVEEHEVEEEEDEIEKKVVGEKCPRRDRPPGSKKKRNPIERGRKEENESDNKGNGLQELEELERSVMRTRQMVATDTTEAQARAGESEEEKEKEEQEDVAEKKDVPERRGPGRPLGSKNKSTKRGREEEDVEKGRDREGKRRSTRQTVAKYSAKGGADLSESEDEEKEEKEEEEEKKEKKIANTIMTHCLGHKSIDGPLVACVESFPSNSRKKRCKSCGKRQNSYNQSLQNSERYKEGGIR